MCSLVFDDTVAGGGALPKGSPLLQTHALQDTGIYSKNEGDLLQSDHRSCGKWLVTDIFINCEGIRDKTGFLFNIHCHSYCYNPIF